MATQPSMRPSDGTLSMQAIMNQQRDDFRVKVDDAGAPTTRVLWQFDDRSGFKRSRTVTYNTSDTEISAWSEWVAQ